VANNNSNNGNSPTPRPSSGHSKHCSTPAAVAYPLPSGAAPLPAVAPSPHQGAHRPATVQAGAFHQARERANSTPRPSEWIQPSPQKLIQKQLPLPGSEAEHDKPNPSLGPPKSHAQEHLKARSKALPLPGSTSWQSLADLQELAITETPLSKPATELPAAKAVARPDVKKESPSPLNDQDSQEEHIRSQIVQSQPKAAPSSRRRSMSQGAHRVNPTLGPSIPTSHHHVQETFTPPSNPARQSLQMERARSANEAMVFQQSRESASALVANGGSTNNKRPRSMTLTQCNVEQAFGDMIVSDRPVCQDWKELM